MQTNPESAAVEAVAVVMRDGYICWLTSWLMSENYVKSQQGDKLYPQSALDALRGEVERKSEQMEIVYRYLQKVAPWSESNDMLWCDEVVCGIDGLLQAVADLEADAKRYRWLRDGKAVAPKGDYPVAKSYQHGNTLWNEALDASVDAALTKESP